MNLKLLNHSFKEFVNLLISFPTKCLSLRNSFFDFELQLGRSITNHPNMSNSFFHRNRHDFSLILFILYILKLFNMNVIKLSFDDGNFHWSEYVHRLCLTQSDVFVFTFVNSIDTDLVGVCIILKLIDLKK